MSARDMSTKILMGLVAGVGLAAPACTDPGDSAVVWAPYEPGSSCEISKKVFGPYCVSCHDGKIEPLDLRGPALGTLANKVGDEWGQVLVVPGDPDASFLYKKCVPPGPAEGDLMPQTGAMPQEALDALRSWIVAGAPACTTIGADIEVGGPVDFGGPPSGYAAKQPTWTPAGGSCSSDQWWQFEGLWASDLMHPGYDCINCHVQADGPGFSYAGTVYPEVFDPDDCRGVPGVRVEILDGAGNALGAATTNEAGNFYFSGGYVDGYRARLTYQGRTREMTLPVTGNGACNDCHGPSGTQGAPGRVVAP